MQGAHAEERAFEAEAADLENWWKSDRFKFTKRPYSSKEVVALRGTVTQPPMANITGKKLYGLCRERFNQRKYTHTFGALDPVQVVQMAKYLECVYVSGWQCSSTASTSNEPGPDFADYPANTVPNKVDQLFKAQMFHDKRQRFERAQMTTEEKAKNAPVDYFRPIIADGDTGFGGITSVMKMVRCRWTLELEAFTSRIKNQVLKNVDIWEVKFWYQFVNIVIEWLLLDFNVISWE